VFIFVNITWKNRINMGKTITISNQKGGVGKTTTSVNLAASLGAMEKKILLVDLDPQGNASSGVGIQIESEQPQVYHVLLSEKPIQQVIMQTEVPFLKLVPAGSDLIGFEIEGIEIENREQCLKKALSQISQDFDYIIIDCPPSLGLLTVNALTAADHVIVPLQAEYYALEGLSRLLQTIELIQKSINPELTLAGIVLTMFDQRNSLAHQVADEVKEHFPTKLRLSEAPSFGKPVLLYDVRSSGAVSYLQLAQEFVEKFEQKQENETVSTNATR
jgi:chromosome partitioning protein